MGELMAGAAETDLDRAADVQAWLELRAGEMAALLEALVAIDTENPPGRGLGRCGRMLRDAMTGLGLSPELIELPPARDLEEPCVLRGEVGAGPRTVYFHGHFDVVPAQSRAQFVPSRANGRIAGRGTADMKGGLVSMLYGAAAARDLGLLDDGRVVLHLVCDEETGSVSGSGHLRAAGLIDPGAVAMVTAEPTGGVVWHASRGAITLRVEVQGRTAHVGQAHLGVNAFEQMVQIAEPLADLAHELLARRTDYPLESDEARGSMLVVGGASGSGANFNVVPGTAWFSVDRRFNPEESLGEELARLTSTIAGRRDARRRRRQGRGPAGAAVGRNRRARSRRARSRALRGGGRGRGAALRDVPWCPRDSLVRATRHPGIRLWRRPARRLARPGRVHRRGRDAPLRRRLRTVRRSRRVTRAERVRSSGGA